MSSSQYDFSKLYINFTLCPKETRLIEFFPELKIFPEIVQQQDDNIIKIAILTSDKDSPFWKMRADRASMIGAIFEYLEIGTKNQRGQKYFNDVMNYTHEGVSQCWLAYLQLQHSVDFNDWLITRSTYDMLMQESTRERKEEEDAMKYADWRVKLRNSIKQIGAQLKEIEGVVFPDSKMVQPVVIEEIRRKIKSYPEKHQMHDTII